MEVRRSGSSDTLLNFSSSYSNTMSVVDGVRDLWIFEEVLSFMSFDLVDILGASLYVM